MPPKRKVVKVSDKNDSKKRTKKVNNGLNERDELLKRMKDNCAFNVQRKALKIDSESDDDFESTARVTRKRKPPVAKRKNNGTEKLPVKTDGKVCTSEEKAAGPKEENVLSVEVGKLSDSESETELVQVAEIKDVQQNGNSNVATSDESSDCEWEEVAEEDAEELVRKEPVIPKDGVEIEIDAAAMTGRRLKRNEKFDLEGHLRRHVNRFKKGVQMNLHKVHLLCLLAHGVYVNRLCNESDTFRGLAMSVMPHRYEKKKTKTVQMKDIECLLAWFQKEFVLGKPQIDREILLSMSNNIILGFDRKKFETVESYVVAFVVLLRRAGFEVRLVISLQPLSAKPKDLIKSVPKTLGMKSNKGNGKSKNAAKHEVSIKPQKKLPKTKVLKQSHQIDRPERSLRTRRNIKKPIVEENSHSGSDFESEEEPKIAMRKTRKNKVSAQDSSPQKIEAKSVKHGKHSSKSDSDYATENLPSRGLSKRLSKGEEKGIDYWVEVYLDAESRWICVDCVMGKADCVSEMEARATLPISYVLAFDNKNCVKDVTKRYASDWMVHTRKLRFNVNWWEETLQPFRMDNTKRDKEEDAQLETNLAERPLPKTIGEFKSHPLYVLKRHLLKFEALYPPESLPVGFIRSEPVYARECVHTLHSRETWLKEARTVRIGEEPYKIVKARPKWNKMTGQMDSSLPLEVFGKWQTQDYEPPVAKNGKVPRSEYGSVELFKPCMLPIGTVHLPIPGLSRVAKKLGIDCAPAMIGWEAHVRGSIPVYDGFVICEEFKDTVLEAWREQQIIDQKRQKEKREKRVYGNWRRLIKAALIRKRLEARYSNDNIEQNEPSLDVAKDEEI